MSSKKSKLSRKTVKKEMQRETQKIAVEQIKELFAASLWIRFKFAFRLIFKR